MREFLVTFEIAKQAKEKGFNWPTDHYYEESLTESVDEQDGTSGPFGWKKGERNLQLGYMINNHDKTDLSSESWYVCSVPLCGQLQKWLRDEHNLHIAIGNGDISNTWNYEIYTIGKIDINKSTDFKFKTYEDALEAGLLEALKLI